MLILVEIIKFLGTAIATTAAIIGTYLDETKSAISGRLTRKGKIIVAFAVIGFLLSAGAQIVQFYDDQASARENRERNDMTATRLERIPKLIARQSFPLQPLELLFSIEYPMDQSDLKSYSTKLQTAIVTYLRAAREGRGKTSDDLADENILFVVTNQHDWMPVEADGSATRLLEDYTDFDFMQPQSQSDVTVTFFSAPASLGEAIVTMPQHGDVEQKVELQADFKRRVFIKRVVCRNPIRTGTDALAFSTIDLIGRQMTWKSGVETSLNWKLVSFGMRFSYDYGFAQNYQTLSAGREIAINGSTSIKMTSQFLGLQALEN
jgi:hypothetical protein